MTAVFDSTAGGQRHCNAAVFASLEKIAAHFSNPPSADRTKEGGLCNDWLEEMQLQNYLW